MKHSAVSRVDEPLPAGFGLVFARLLRKHPDKEHADAANALRSALALMEFGVSRTAIFAAADLFLNAPDAGERLRRVFR